MSTELMALIDAYADTSAVNGIRSQWAQMARGKVELALKQLPALQMHTDAGDAELIQALGDLSFACFAGIGTKAPDAETFNRTFAVLEKHRALLATATGLPAQAVPDFCHVASLKLKSLQERGYQITGYALEKPVEGAQPERGFINHGGFVGWWWDGQSPQAQADTRDASNEWEEITTLPTCDDLIWLYCQDTHTVDGPVAPHPSYEDSWTHWAYANAPSTAAIAAHAAQQEGDKR